MESSAIHFSAEARQYAVVELCRRAGLSGEAVAQRWRLQQTPSGEFSLIFQSGTRLRRIHFPAANEPLSADCVVRKAWPSATAQPGIPDLVVPYAAKDSVSGQPLFLPSNQGDFSCTEDLLATTVLVLSRFEEIRSPHKDSHGRFLCSASLAHRHGYLDRPIIDEYGLALQQIIEQLDPEFEAAPRQLRVKVSHDVDSIGIPFNLREPAVQLLGRRSVATGIRDLLSGVFPCTPGSLLQVREVCELAQHRGLRSALYWKAARRTRFDSGYDIRDPRLRPVIHQATAGGIEMGVHPGYDTFHSLPELQAEIARLRKVLGGGPLGGRQHFLRWSPETWAHWEQCGLAYDSSVGFAERAGFRAGTCWPYSPWLWDQNRTANLLEIPLILMDRTIVSPEYMRATPQQSLEVVRDLKRKCETVGGVFTVLWHNNCLGHPYSNYYPALLDELAGTPNYDWQADQQAMAAPALQSLRR